MHATTTGPLTLIGHQQATTAGFVAWLDMLKQGADAEDWGGWFMPAERLFFRHLPADPFRIRTVFSTEASSEDAAVQISEPGIAGNEQSLGGLAVDATGRHYIVRQGVLRENRVSGTIDAPAFERATGLLPVEMTANGKRSTKRWHVVAPLDGVTPDEVQRRTAAFVEHCWAARTWTGDAAIAQQHAVALFGKDEQGGTTTVTIDAATREVRRLQGYVWRQLKSLLDADAIVLRKPRHLRGYEVDAEICAPDTPLLVEIKTSNDAAAIYTGVGQLTLYPQLLPHLAQHRQVLLVRGTPRPALAEAVAATGLALYGFTLDESQSPPVATFEPAFLAACGLAT